MKYRHIIVLIVLIVIIFNGCTQSNNKLNDNQNLKFPEKIELSYKEIDLNELETANSIVSEEVIKSLKLGNINDNEINVELYTSNNEDIVNGTFKYKDKNYIIKDLGYSHDIESIKIFNIQKAYKNNENITLISAIGSPILGYKYLFYSEYNNNWYLYNNWGVPKLCDINEDNVYEILIQFEGLHNNFPNLNILRWNEDKFEVASVNNDVLKSMKIDTTSIKLSSTYEAEKNKVIVKVSTIGKEETEAVKYILKIKSLVKF